MRNLNFLKLFYGLMLVMVSTVAVSCVDDNEDTEAPFLEVSPTTLIFGLDGQPASGSQATFDISTNRSWKATVEEDKSWVTLSKDKGEGPATIQVSIPEGINDEATVVIEISNKVGPLLSKTLIIKSGETVTPVEIYKENIGTVALDKNNWPFVNTYEGWGKTGIGSETVTYTGENASVRSSGLASTDAYPGASGPNVIFFGKLPASFTINKITLAPGQKNLQLTFGASRSVNNNGTYDNSFDVSKFEVALSADGTTWAPLSYDRNNGDTKTPFWIFATANFTLSQVPEFLYIKFTALDASAIRLDDITLATGIGGNEIDLGAAGEPKATTADAVSITDNSAILGGSIAYMNVADATEVGVQYIAFSTGTVTNIDWATATKTAAAPKVSPWTVSVTNLTKDAQYAFRAYATTASGSIYGEPKTFVAMTTATTPIAIASLIEKMTTTATVVDADYTIQGVICGDPAGKNYSYGTLYIMTKGATTAGNALSLYNNQIDVTQYKLGQEIKVTLPKDVAKIYKRYDVPQVEGFSTDNIKVVSENNDVTPIIVTVAQLASFVCMPVTIENATIATGGIWKKPTLLGTHTFNVSGTSFTVSVNKGATPFDDQPFKADKNSLTGIASIFGGAGQLAPRNLDDVKAFKLTDAMIISVDPESWSFPSDGGTKAFQVKVENIDNNQLLATGLSGILSSTVSGTTVTVTAQANISTQSVNQTLNISLANGSTISVAITVKGAGETDTKGTYTSMTPFLFNSGSDKVNAYSQKLSIDENEIESLKLGTGSKSGAFTTGTLGVSGNKKLSFYAAAWNKETMTVYIRVNGGGNVSGTDNISAAANADVAGTGTFTVTFSDSDYYTLNLTGLTPESTITIATDANFNGAGGKARGVMCGFQLY